MKPPIDQDQAFRRVRVRSGHDTSKVSERREAYKAREKLSQVDRFLEINVSKVQVVVADCRPFPFLLSGSVFHFHEGRQEDEGSLAKKKQNFGRAPGRNTTPHCVPPHEPKIAVEWESSRRMRKRIKVQKRKVVEVNHLMGLFEMKDGRHQATGH